MLFQTQKPKSASKLMIPSSDELNQEVLSTLKWIAQMAGVTLGPGGRQVLIERGEMGLKPIMTKDGVTVVKNLGFHSAQKQLILEAAREAAIRTATEAGDGTTTATILSASIAEATADISKKNPLISPQRIVRELQSIAPLVETMVKKYAIKITGDNYDEVILNVAKLSANGDTVLAQKILECLNMVGDDGNLTIVEQSDKSGLTVDQIRGYPVDIGYEESCKNFGYQFINDKSGTQVVMDDPVVLLYDGAVNDHNTWVEFFGRLGQAAKLKDGKTLYVALVAHGFSDSILGTLMNNWVHPKSEVKVLPIVTPRRAIMNWSSDFLRDLHYYTGASILNPVDRNPLKMDVTSLLKNNRVTHIECGRFMTNIEAKEDNELLQERTTELKERLKKPESQLEANDLQVRLGKLTNGIARLTIAGPSTIETREKRDRAEDAWMAIRGAVKHGAVPGGGYVLTKVAADLLNLAEKFRESNEAGALALEILGAALVRPIEVLYHNYGYRGEQIEKIKIEILKNNDQVFNILEQEWVDKHTLLDSAPAVIEAIRNSISIASLFGTIGGIIAFERDGATDKAEEDYVRRFTAASGDRNYE